MSTGSDGSGPIWSAVLERFERHAPTRLMARLALEHALLAGQRHVAGVATQRRLDEGEPLLVTVALPIRAGGDGLVVVPPPLDGSSSVLAAGVLGQMLLAA